MLTRKIHYKLRILGVPIYRPYKMLGDNDSMSNLFSINYSTIKENNNYIVCNQVRVYVAAGVIIMAHITIEYNTSDLLTKTLGTQKHYALMK